MITGNRTKGDEMERKNARRKIQGLSQVNIEKIKNRRVDLIKLLNRIGQDQNIEGGEFSYEDKDATPMSKNCLVIVDI